MFIFGIVLYLFFFLTILHHTHDTYLLYSLYFDFRIKFAKPSNVIFLKVLLIAVEIGTYFCNKAFSYLVFVIALFSPFFWYNVLLSMYLLRNVVIEKYGFIKPVFKNFLISLNNFYNSD